MKRGIRIIVYIVIVIFILFFGIQWFLESKIKDIVEKEVSEMTQGAVKVEIGSVSLRLVGRKLWLENVKICSDTGVLHRNGLILKATEGYFKRVGVSGIHFQKQDSVIHLRARKFELEVSRLSADFLRQSPVPRQTGRTLPGIHLQVQTVQLRLGQIHCQTVEGIDSVDYRLDDFDGEVRDLEVNTLIQNDGLPFSCKDIQMLLSSFQYRFAEKSQMLEVDSLHFQGAQGQFVVGNIRLIPRYSMYEFAQKAPGHTDWTSIEAGGLRGTGFRLQQLMTLKFINIDSLTLDKAFISSFKNRKIEQKPKIKRLFYEAVQEFPLPFAMRRFNLNQVDVEYLELARNGLSPGKITFNNLRGVFSGMTNRTTSEYASYKLEAEGKLMDQGYIQAVFNFPVDSLNPFFEVNGKMGTLQLTALNPMIEPLAKIKITSGRMEEMTFGIKGNSQKAQVDMTFLYEQLRIRIMKEKNGQLETSSFLTTLANGLIVKENNPDHRGIRKGEGMAERDPYRSQFNYLWKTLLQGLKQSVGL